MRMEDVSNVKYILPAEKCIEQLPGYENFGHKSKLRLNPYKVPNLNWKWCEELNTTSVGQTVMINTVYIGTILKSQAQLNCDCCLIASPIWLPIMSVKH